MKKTTRRAICVVETPFQVLGAICLAVQLKKSGDYRFDILLSSRIPQAGELVGRLRREAVFENVFITNGYYIERRSPGVDFIREAVLAHDHGRSLFEVICPYLIGQHYDILLCSGVTRLTLDVKRFLVRDGASWFFDDGTGSHTGEVFTAFLFFDKRILVKGRRESLKNRVKEVAKKLFYPTAIALQCKYDIEELWLFAPTKLDVSNYRSWVSIKEIQLDLPLGLLERIFHDAPLDAYIDTKYIYLTLPDDVAESAKKTELELCRIMSSSFGADFAIRLHPRRASADFPVNSFNILPRTVLWEMAVLTGAVSNDTVLIAAGSTAQLTPCQLKRCFPPLVLAYRLFEKDGLQVSAFESVASTLLDKYSQNGGVFVPESLDELRRILHF